MQMFPCQSAKPNSIMIVADDLVSWKFIFSVFLKQFLKFDSLHNFISPPLCWGGRDGGYNFQSHTLK